MERPVRRTGTILEIDSRTAGPVETRPVTSAGRASCTRRSPWWTASPTRPRTASQGAAIYDREEGAWVGKGRVYVDCTEGVERNLGQVFEYHLGRGIIKLIYESND